MLFDDHDRLAFRGARFWKDLKRILAVQASVRKAGGACIFEDAMVHRDQILTFLMNC
jgi:hypothetical protein